jgi:hypothetical protein
MSFPENKYAKKSTHMSVAHAKFLDEKIRSREWKMYWI